MKADIVKYIPTKKLEPNPHNPRKDVGDVTELAESIKANGILQNLTVVKHKGEITGNWNEQDYGYWVLIGHRRLAAAKLAGVTEVPCVVLEELSEDEQIKIMLMENMHREDLTVYEQAQCFQMMLDLGESIGEISKDTGFSESTIRRRTKLLSLDKEKFKESEARGGTLTDYMELDAIKDEELRNKALGFIGTADFRNELRRIKSEDELKTKLDGFEAIIATYATKIEERGKVDGQEVKMDLEPYFGSYGNEEVKVPNDAGERRYFYTRGSTYIQTYAEHIDVPIDEEEKRRIEELEAYNRRRQVEAEDIKKRHFELRRDFIKEARGAKNHIPELCRFSVDRLLNMGSDLWRYRDNEAEILEYLLDISEETDNIIPIVRKRAKQNPEYTLLCTGYAKADSPDYSYIGWKWQDGKKLFFYHENEYLDNLYSFLGLLGYEMSAEEKAMQDGSHPFFDKPKESEENDE